MLRPLTLLAFAAMTACSAPADRLALTAAPSTLELQPLVRSAMVRTVSLPTYAAAEELAVQSPSGLISSNQNVLWADDPQRAITLAIADTLGDILNTDVGPDPWPFIGLPDVAVDVRVTQMLAGSDGIFRLSGQYFVGGEGIDFPNSANRFAISQPMADQELSSIANAQAAALLTLSEDIARRLAR
ncbi:PqiC family protein [Loktanella sp. S4079]|uniref:PqiC family protein n=1 Tax=Loktanella sp. S4079 TaxID=579483 RepID=UPI0005FA1CC3|nr:ABC-type transport auxiliary lipoprotein family protein [Loktanella sp. S4079]KJZ20445.1 lipoprotein [Loktanella sp. S4079]